MPKLIKLPGKKDRESIKNKTCMKCKIQLDDENAYLIIPLPDNLRGGHFEFTSDEAYKLMVGYACQQCNAFMQGAN